MQRRRNERYRLEVPVLFSWEDQRGRWHKARGSTQDISPQGAYVRARRCPPAGSQLRVQVLLPPLGPDQPSLMLDGNARVLRVEPAVRKSQRKGFAILGKSLTLRDRNGGWSGIAS